MSELKSIFSDGRIIKVADRDIMIKSIELGQIPDLIDVGTKLIALLPDGKKNISKIEIAKAIGKDFGSITKLFEITTDLDESTIKKLNLAAATVILENIIKDNADFFLANVLPLVKGMATNLSGLIPGTTKSKN